MSAQISQTSQTHTNPGEESAAEMVDELMGLMVAVGLIVGAIIGVMLLIFGFSGSFEPGDAVLYGALGGGAVGAILSFFTVRVLGKRMERDS
jgi:hypothetical protein